MLLVCSDIALPARSSPEARFASEKINVSIRPIAMKGWLVSLGSSAGGSALERLCNSPAEAQEWLTSIADNLAVD